MTELKAQGVKTTMLANLNELGFSAGAIHIIQIFSPVIGGAIMYGRDLFGEKSLNDAAGAKD